MSSRLLEENQKQDSASSLYENFTQPSFVSSCKKETKKQPEQNSIGAPSSPNNVSFLNLRASHLSNSMHRMSHSVKMRFPRGILYGCLSAGIKNFSSLTCTVMTFGTALGVFMVLFSVIWATLYGISERRHSEKVSRDAALAASRAIEAEIRLMSSVVDSTVATNPHLISQNDSMLLPAWNSFEFVRKRFHHIKVTLYSINMESSLSFDNLNADSRTILTAENLPRLSNDVRRVYTFNHTSKAPGEVLFEGAFTPVSPLEVNRTIHFPNHFGDIKLHECPSNVDGIHCPTPQPLLPYQSAMVSNNTVKYMLQYSFPLDQLNDIIQQCERQNDAASTQTFVMQQHDQKLLAVSFAETTQSKILMTPAHECSDALIAGVVSEMRSKYGTQLAGLSQTSRHHKRSDSTFQFSYKSHRVVIAQIPMQDSEHHLLLVRISELETSAIVIGATICSIVCLVAILSTCCMTSFNYLFVSRPLNRVTKQLASAKNMDFKRVGPLGFSHLYELKKLNSEYLKLRSSMKNCRPFLPSYLLQIAEAKETLTKKPSQKRISPESHSMDKKGSAKLNVVPSAIPFASSSSRFTQSCLDKQLNVGTRMRLISVVELHVLDIEGILHTMSFDDYQNLHTVLVEAVTRIVRSTPGANLTSFSHNSFLISFNSLDHAGDDYCEHYEKRAVSCAIKLRKILEQCNRNFVNTGYRNLPLLVCVCTGGSMVGVLGNKKIKHRSIHGYPLLLSRVIRNSLFLRLGVRALRAQFENGHVLVITDQETREKVVSHNLKCEQVDYLKVRYNGTQKVTRLFELLEGYDMDDIAEDSGESWLYSGSTPDSESCEEGVTTTAWRLLEQNQCQQAIDVLRDELDYHSELRYKRSPSQSFSTLSDTSSSPFTNTFSFSLLNLCITIQERFNGDFSKYRHIAETGGAEWYEYERMEWKSASVVPIS